MPLTRPPLLRCLGVLVLGAVLGLLGSFMFRSIAPWGLVLACATLLAAGVLARSWAQAAGVVSFALGWLVTVQILALEGPGGDVVIPAQSIAYVWVYGGIVFILAALVLPRAWFSDAEFDAA